MPSRLKMYIKYMIWLNGFLQSFTKEALPMHNASGSRNPHLLESLHDLPILASANHPRAGISRWNSQPPISTPGLRRQSNRGLHSRSFHSAFIGFPVLIDHRHSFCVSLEDAG